MLPTFTPHRVVPGLALLVAVVISQSASAGLFRAYLSVNGQDSNPCAVTAPCRLLPAALNAVNDGGEIWMLDSANYNNTQVDISKSVTILAVPGALGSVVTTSGNAAIVINTPNVRVTLRNLTIKPLDCCGAGIAFDQGAELNVDGCEISNITSPAAIFAIAPNSRVTVTNTTLRDNAGDGFLTFSSVTASLDRVRFRGNGTAVSAGNDANVTVSNSVIANNLIGVAVQANDGKTARLVMTRSVVTGNSTGIVAEALPASTASVLSDGNVVSNNGVAFRLLSSGGTQTIYTRQNNTVQFNETPVAGGSLTPVDAM